VAQDTTLDNSQAHIDLMQKKDLEDPLKEGDVSPTAIGM